MRESPSMFKINKKEYKLTILSIAAVCLTNTLSYHAIASTSSNKADFLSPILYLLQESESRSNEFGTLIPGKLYSASELNFWRNRAQNGPHITRGDAYGTSTTGSNPDYQIIKGGSLSFDNVDDSDIVLAGISRASLENKGLTAAELAEIDFFDDCAIIDPTNGDTFYAWYEFGRFALARDAAFIDLLEGTSTHTNRIKRLLLQQAQELCINFANRNIFQNGPNNNAFWLYLEWIHQAFGVQAVIQKHPIYDCLQVITYQYYHNKEVHHYENRDTIAKGTLRKL